MAWRGRGLDGPARRAVGFIAVEGTSPIGGLRDSWSSAYAARSASVIGRRLGHYEIVAKLGEGGMGVVYQAIDTLLNRPVALKVIAAPGSTDPQRRKRFLHEAQAASALNHPSIVTIYGIETASLADGPIDVIAMECVVGRTMDQVIGQKPMPLGQILDYAVQIADALAAAHAAGIIHRDLKPSNVMVTETGRVKVLDFGLAKLVAIGSAEGTRTGQGEEAPLTSDGAVLGTASYMSPEQAEGRRLDARSDVFAFGALLYEMITGRRAFRGDSRLSILSAIVREPHEPLRTARPDAPEELERIVAHCLRKDPARRFQHMDEARVALEDVRDESVSRREGGTRPPRALTRVTRLAFCLLALVAVVGGALAWRRATAPDTERDRSLTQITRDSGLTTDAAPSPAGNLLAYASDRSGEGNLDIWVQPLPRGEAIRLTRSGADDHEPSFSPDGSRIAFRSEREGGGIYVISALGGHEVLIAAKGRRPRFSPDGNWIAYFVGDTLLSSGAVHIVPATGGTPRQLGASDLRARQPIWSPDGKHVLCTAFPIEKIATRDWIVVPVDGGDPVATGAGEAFLRANITGSQGIGPRGIELTPDAWAPDGETVFFSAQSGDTTNVWKLRLSPKTWRVAGAPQQVTFGTSSLEKPALLGLHRLFLTSAVANVDLWSLPTDPLTGAVAGEMERITREPGNDDWPSISADGRRVAYLSQRSGSRAVWVQDLGRPGALATTVSPDGVAYPRIAADGSRVGYLRPIDATREPPPPALPADPSRAPQLVLPNFQRGTLFVASISPTGEAGVPRSVCQDCGRLWDWSRDDRYVLYRGASALMLLDVETGARTELARSTVTLFDPRFSPDDRWIAFTVHTGPLTRQQNVAPFRGPVPIPQSDWIPITDGQALDRQVSWAPRGDMLYFHSERDGFRCIWAARLHPTTKRPLGPPFPVQHFHGAQRSMVTAIGDPGAISISAGGNRLVFSLGEMTGNIWMTSY